MATKRKDMKELVEKTMENRDIRSNTQEIKPIDGWKTHQKRQVQVRFDEGDYEALQEIASNRGTKAAALI